MILCFCGYINVLYSAVKLLLHRPVNKGVGLPLCFLTSVKIVILKG